MVEEKIIGIEYPPGTTLLCPRDHITVEDVYGGKFICIRKSTLVYMGETPKVVTSIDGIQRLATRVEKVKKVNFM